MPARFGEPRGRQGSVLFGPTAGVDALPVLACPVGVSARIVRALFAGLWLLAGAPRCQGQRSAGGEAPASAVSASLAPQAATAPSALSPPAPSAPCSTVCAPGSSCQLTKNGPACVACAPGSVPTCQDERFVATCRDDGTLAPSLDCGAQKKRCDRGRCVDPECRPGALHCFEGDIYRCSADGSDRTLATRCVVTGPDGSLDASKGLCQVKNGTPACRTSCSLPDHSIVALRDCGACEWDKATFCATESPERACSDWICLKDGTMGFGAVSIPCFRDTDGLVVPGSDERGACEGPGAPGVTASRTVTYAVCRGGQPARATRVEPCTK